MALSAVLSVCLLCVCCLVKSQRHFVPEAKLEFLNPDGLKISLPDWNPAVKLVAFHININEEFSGVEHGQYAADITRKKSGRWTWVIPGFKVKQGDTIYYWINVIEDNQSYNGLDREHKVTVSNPHEGDVDRIPTSPATTTPKSCVPSQSTVNGRTACQLEVLLDKRFDNLEGWSHQVSIGGDHPDDEFTIFLKESYASWVEGGKLYIKPSLLEEKYNDSFVRSGELLLPGCTSSVPVQCSKRASAFLILPPIISARLTTKDNFSFRYGFVEIRAKLPQGMWIVPELWLEPVNGPVSERVVVGLSRGNMDDSEFGWKTLEAGVTGAQTSLRKKTQDTPWGQDFHTFKLVWTPGKMQFFVDNQQFQEVATGSYPIMNKEVYVSLGVHVAGLTDFPDNITGKPWKNSSPKPIVWEKYDLYIMETYNMMERFLRFWDAKSSWYPSWNENSALQIESIKITAI
ncbi:beta-1,3-glucan-binding protein-like isoform X1 [Macrosteles quadrilineatus]|uniref:beta-1,3-glucan-binding protein-like isoform X1 n=1 Tax=Macrosteles quadrilineatus TaxID=74068 RepID=UPI0023E2B9BC|nr:beta-1,3-glucan-binding protein-like isoform X1 [Macrosteles quadrilineatus]